MDAVAREYLENRIRTSSPMELVLILYEGAIQHLLEAKSSMESRQIDRKTLAVNRTSRFIAELQLALNMEHGGEVAAQLSRLYQYFQQRLIQASIQNSIPLMDEVLKLLRGLHETWAQLIQKTKGEISAQVPLGKPGAQASQRISLSI